MEGRTVDVAGSVAEESTGGQSEGYEEGREEVSASVDSTQRHWVMYVCALRFDGYRYHEQRNPSDQHYGWLYDVAQTFIETNSLQTEPLDNWAAFFALQRRLGDRQIELPDEERAFMTLFLHFYQEPTPSEFIKADYHQQWERHRPEAEAVAQWARAELLHMSAA